MDFQWATPIFNFATVRATPTRRSIGDKSVEILIAPTSSSSHEAGVVGALIPIDLHASHVSVNDRTYTTQSDCFYHEFHPHSAVTCDGSPLSEPELLWRNTAHRMDALQHTCHGSASMHGRNAAWYLYPGRTSHCSLFHCSMFIAGNLQLRFAPHPRIWQAPDALRFVLNHCYLQSHSRINPHDKSFFLSYT